MTDRAVSVAWSVLDELRDLAGSHVMQIPTRNPYRRECIDAVFKAADRALAAAPSPPALSGEAGRAIIDAVPILAGPVKRLEKLDGASVVALADIAEERARQVEAEGWTPEHDDKHHSGELSAAAAAYSLAPHTNSLTKGLCPSFWPWSQEWWKPHSLHRNRVRAGALLVAELARHLRSYKP